MEEPDCVRAGRAHYRRLRPPGHLLRHVSAESARRRAPPSAPGGARAASRTWRSPAGPAHPAVWENAPRCTLEYALSWTHSTWSSAGTVHPDLPRPGGRGPRAPRTAMVARIKASVDAAETGCSLGCGGCACGSRLSPTGRAGLYRCAPVPGTGGCGRVGTTPAVPVGCEEPIRVCGLGGTGESCPVGVVPPGTGTTDPTDTTTDTPSR